MADKFKVVVLMEESLLENGIVQRLLEEPDLVVQVMKKDCADISSKLAAFHPEVAILDERDAALRGRILATFPQSIVVTVSFERDGAVVYRPRRLSINTVKELVEHLRKAGRFALGSNRGKRKSG